MSEPRGILGKASVSDAIAPYRKAVSAAVFAATAALGGSMLDGNLTGAEAIVAAGMGLVAGAATYRIPNAQ